jgi:hypothetical protein
MKFESPLFLSTMQIFLSLYEPTLWAMVCRANLGACATPIAHGGGLLQKDNPRKLFKTSRDRINRRWGSALGLWNQPDEV